MKKQMTTLLLIICGGAVAGGKPELQTRLELCRPLSGMPAENSYERIKVTGDVFDRCRDFPNDLRIIDAEGTQWPFYLWQSEDHTVSRELKPELMNLSRVEGPDGYLQFDLQIPPAAGTPTGHNRLELETSGQDYIRRVELFTDTEPHGRIAAGSLIDLTRPARVSNRIIRYPVTDQSRLHVRIYPNARNAAETFSVKSAKVFFRTCLPAEREPVPCTLIASEKDAPREAQQLILDTGYENRPVEFITFETDVPSFARRVTAYQRNRENEAWRWAGSGEIHRFDEESETELTLRARARFLKVIVYHHDDPPIEFSAIRLEAVPRWLVFQAQSTRPAALCFRAWDLRAPRYDLKTRFTGNPRELEVRPTLPARPNRQSVEQPWRRYSKALAAAAVGVVSLIVLSVIIRMLKKQSPV